MKRRLGLVLAVLAVWGGTIAAGEDQWDPSTGEWRLGRATHYSAPGDVWTIHDGSCTHKYIWPDVGPGEAWLLPSVDLHLAAPFPAPEASVDSAHLCQALAGWDAGALDDQADDFIGSCG